MTRPILAIVGFSAAAGLAAASSGCTSVPDQVTAVERGDSAPAVGLALEVENGVGAALKLRRGQTYYLNQIDLHAAIDATTDEGVAGLATQGDFAGLSWRGTELADHEPVLLANADGTYRMRKFYRGSVWMDEPSQFVFEQLDDHGRPVAPAMVFRAGVDDDRRDSDDFFDRRLRAIQWINDCRSTTDCTGATSFQEEALVELRYAMHPARTFALDPRTASIRLRWSIRPGAPYTIPVEQITDPPFAYGFAIDVETVTPPRADGTYAPGSDITFRVALEDGQGTILHDPDQLPSYNDVIFGADEPGIQYYRAFFDETTTYYRRKHRERMMMAELLGPAQNAQPLRSVIELDKFLTPDDVQDTATLERDGVFAQFHTFPTAHDLFGGAFDPNHAGWANPVPTTWTHHVPDNAPPGTYYMTIKGRRTYMGEDVPYTRTLEVQIGSPQQTQPNLNTGPCNSCHSGQSSLANILHANAQRGTCAGCHVPLGFELEGPIYVRTHFIHSRSNRYDAPLERCASCHLTRDSIQRTSKSACLSCHKSYPASHVRAYGPIESMYVGGGRESFMQCTTACHRTHPGSDL